MPCEHNVTALSWAAMYNWDLSAFVTLEEGYWTGRWRGGPTWRRQEQDPWLGTSHLRGHTAV